MASAWGNSSDPSKRLGGLMWGISPTDFSGQTDRLLQQSAYNNAQALSGTGQGASSGGVGTAQSNWANALKNTEGRGDAVMNDPYTQAALSRFQNVLSGADEPYTQQVQSQLLARQADAGAASAASQGQMLRDSQAALGGSMADPQAQAAMRQIMAANQQQNNANLGDMNSKATLANFGAKNDAASNLAATRGGQLGMANSQYNQASQLYANQQLAGQHVNAVNGGPGSQFGGAQQIGGGGGYTNIYGETSTGGMPGTAGMSNAGLIPGPGQNYGGGYGAQPNGNQAPAGQNAAGGYGNTSYGPPSPGGQSSGNADFHTRAVSNTGAWRPVIGNSSYGQSYGRPATPAYDANGTNTTTGTGYGSGYVQQAGQPNTRVQYGLGQYQPNLPVY